MSITRIFQQIKGSVLPVNFTLLKLKLVYFLVYAEWVSALPYVTLISTRIITLQELALTFSCIPLSSILGPIFVGFLADKIGNYKTILMFTNLLGALVYLPILYLAASERVLNATFSGNNTYNINDFQNESVTNAPHQDLNKAQSSDFTFPALLLMRIFGYFAMDSTNMLLDSCGISISQKCKAEFGKQKMWATCSMTVIPLICGLLIDIISRYRGFQDFSVALYISAGCSFIASIIILQLDIDVPTKKRSLLKAARKTIGMLDVNIFFFVQMIAGTCWGLHMNFFSIYVDADLKASKTLFGGALCVSGIGSVVMFWLAKVIVARFGIVNTVVIGLSCYSIRFVIYYFLETSWIILLTEAIDGLSGFLALVAGNFYCSDMCAPGMPTAGMLASLNGILFAANFGAGRTLGTTIGSSLLSKNGMRLSYLVFGIVSGVTAIFYFTTYHGFLSNIQKSRLCGTEKTEIDGIVNVAMDFKEEHPAGFSANRHEHQITEL